MLKLFKSIKLFHVYLKSIKENEKYLAERYGLNIDKIGRLWTVLDLSDIPPEIVKQFGAGVKEMEYNKYITAFFADLYRLELEEFVKQYDLKNVSKTQLGITFGFSKFKNEYYYLAKWSIIGLLSIAAIITLLILIF